MGFLLLHHQKANLGAPEQKQKGGKVNAKDQKLSHGVNRKAIKESQKRYTDRDFNEKSHHF